MPESVSGVDEILDGLRERATGWSCVPLADAVAAVHAAADAGRAAERYQAWRWTIHICPKGHKSLEPPLSGVCWKCWPGGVGPAEEHTAVRVMEVRGE